MYNEQIKEWINIYKQDCDMAYPPEYVIRMFKGVYPKLNLQRNGYSGKSILDIGCGDGRNIPLFKQLGFKYIAGTEISKDIVINTSDRLKNIGIEADIRVGKNSNLGFSDGQFDYLLSWNVCYYLDEDMDFLSHVKEYARVMKKGGVFVFSIPCRDCFIYKDAIEHKDSHMMEIVNDYFEIRNGTLQRFFNSEKEIEEVFSSHFKDFVFGKIDDECFGLAYKWYIGYCVKR